MSLRRRLVLGFVTVAAVLVIANVALARTFESFLLDRVDSQLGELASRPYFRAARPGPPPNPDVDRTLSEYFIAVGDQATGTLTELTSLFADEEQPLPRLERDQVLDNAVHHNEAPNPFTTPARSGGGSWRLMAVADPPGRIVVVGVSLDDVQATIGRIRDVQVAGTLAVLAALAMVSWWMLRLGVHPIEDMARTADAIAGGALSARVEHPGQGTEAGRLGIALNAMLERIEDAFRAREVSEERVRRFAADASHELRTPLTSIRGYAELWRAGGLRGDAELDDAMRRMEQEARRMGALVDDLLLLARLDQRRPLLRAPLRLDQIAADGVGDARAVEPDRPIHYAAEPVVVDADESHLRQVVANLLANTRAHTPPGTPVSVSVSSGDGYGRLVVADDGPGMSPEVAAQVFERFYRADASRHRAAGGTGLGLAIVEAVSQAHGGRVEVVSEPGKGSRFIVEVPLAPSITETPHSRFPGSTGTLNGHGD
ncbi:MAG: HAMP domain-containing sensor histidine kinase [Acidimicrobiales bacterium]